MKCTPRYESVPVAARVRGSLVSGHVYETFTSLKFQLGTLKSGPGFPVDRLIAGKSFTFSLKGTSQHSADEEDLKNSSAAQVTDGSVRVVFTPSGRAASSVLAAKATGATSCAKTYPLWWSKKKRACFAVSASAKWRHTTSWTMDQAGQPCKGSDTKSASWTSPADAVLGR